MPLIQDYNKLYEQNSNIKKIYVNGNVVWPVVTPTPPTPGSDYTEPFYVECLSGSVLIKIVSSTSTSYPTGLNFGIQYSTNKTKWSDLGTTGTTSINWGLLQNNRFYLRATTNTWNTNTGAGVTLRVTPQTSGTCKFGGNIMSLLYGSSFTNQTEFPASSSYNFFNVFSSSTALTSAEDLLLPAATLTDACYATMFGQCNNLITAPELTAETLSNACYLSMFSGCSSLNSITCLATNLSATNCLYSWVQDVSATGTFTKKTGVTWPEGVSGIPSGWTVVEV